ncbi:MAG: ABC transporter ATP-binding protein [Methanobrevibacter sp.]|nr:ABC transporter ATP-binding protein [Methanobrevibacter sp.]
MDMKISNDEPFIKISNLVKNYDNGTIKALNGINLEIARGDFISIIGPSGSGKSTLLNMLGALDNPNSGTIQIDGINLEKNQDLSEFRSKKVGFVFQLHNLIPNLTVFENVQIPLIGTGVSENEIEKKAKNLLESVGLKNKLNQKPTKLSGGERQRVAIARALVNNPSIILADEPTGSLDSKTGDVILDMLKKIHDENNVTLIVVTHEPYIANMADRTIKIRDGEIIEDCLNN